MRLDDRVRNSRDRHMRYSGPFDRAAQTIARRHPEYVAGGMIPGAAGVAYVAYQHVKEKQYVFSAGCGALALLIFGIGLNYLRQYWKQK